MAVFAKQGEAPVCFDNEDGHFYACHKDEFGYDVPDFTQPLRSVGDEWHTWDDETPVPHNDIHSTALLDLDVGGEV